MERNAAILLLIAPYIPFILLNVADTNCRISSEFQANLFSISYSLIYTAASNSRFSEVFSFQHKFSTLINWFWIWRYVYGLVGTYKIAYLASTIALPVRNRCGGAGVPTNHWPRSENGVSNAMLFCHKLFYVHIIVFSTKYLFLFKFLLKY